MKDHRERQRKLLQELEAAKRSQSQLLARLCREAGLDELDPATLQGCFLQVAEEARNPATLNRWRKAGEAHFPKAPAKRRQGAGEPAPPDRPLQDVA